ncbi:SPOR domain-containing protein [Aliagarivorans taiwanensis]|uniref:SPOR domain-containing protein n=1 Tax=Aliagarivorans taiwanensis TaxID=561966 RepID=UPI00047B52FD|nr:SPOR domain-containing protein [Aliagarivorans taiwanensis]
MTKQFKNRLLGTIVLVALGVIFIPDVLDGSKTSLQEEFNPIPFSPEVSDLPPLLIDLNPDGDALELAEHDVEVQPAETAQAEQAQAPIDALPEPEENQPPEVVASAPDKEPEVDLAKPAYIIQLGTFKNAANVERLVDKLRQAGYQAHSYPQPAVQDELNRVFVGPNVSKQALEALQGDLEALTGLKGSVRTFDPLFR